MSIVSHRQSTQDTKFKVVISIIIMTSVIDIFMIMGKARDFKNHVTPAVFSFVVTSTNYHIFQITPAEVVYICLSKH